MKKSIFPPTSERVALNTSDAANASIRADALMCLNIFKNCNENMLTEKIRKLSTEWDIERVLETYAAAIILLSSIKGFKKSRYFLVTGAVSFFLLQHALQGWCPPLPILRKLGVRTPEEIYNEKTVLKILRGDFSQPSDNVEDMLMNVEKM